MKTKVRAAVAYGVSQPMRIETLEYDEPVDDQVLVRIVAAGLCHSDLHVLDGSAAGQFPVLLGHEAGAIVERCGDAVQDLKPGDHVVPLFSPECRVCPICRSGRTNLCQHFGMPEGAKGNLRLDGKLLNRYGGLGCFADHLIVPEFALAKIRSDAPLHRAFYSGCGLTTGVGAAMFTAKVQPGEKVIVFGLGGIGLNVLQGARLAKASMIIGVDLNSNREQMARKLGATHFINPNDTGDELAERLVELTSGGADHAFECVGRVQLIETAMACINRFWGVVTVVGSSPAGHVCKTAPFELLVGKKLQGTLFGGAKGRTDVPKIVEWYMNGDLNVDDLITHEIRLEEINAGFDMMKRGESIRSVIRFD